jgi:carboxypeptidase family protein
MPTLRTFRRNLPLIVAVALLGQIGQAAVVGAAETRQVGVSGRVLAEANPLPAVHIWAYELADLKLHKVMTDAQGSFLFQDLPVGLYQIIAHKVGFLPAVISFTRATAEARQFLDVELARRPPGQPHGDDFWEIRAQVPADVLREIEANESSIPLASLTAPRGGVLTGNFKTEMQALTGVDGIAAESGGQLNSAGVGIQGDLGAVHVGLRGQFVQRSSANALQAGGSALGTGTSSSLSIVVAPRPSSRVSIVSRSNRMVARGESGDSPVDFEHYGVNYSQDVGENGHSEFSAHYTIENNFHRQAAIDPLEISDASRDWRFEGAYTFSFSDRNTLQTGMRYRERQFGFGEPDRQGKAFERQALSSLDVFSRGGVRVQPAVLMEYGLYSTLSDGTLALTPQGGVVLQLGSNWQLETTAAHRIYTDVPSGPEFLPTLFAQRDLCEQGSESCYQVNLSRKNGDDNTLSFGAVHRTVGDTLRLYFSDDFFDRQESLYLVRGDELPEIRVGLRHKLAPKVVTTLDTSVASGGGGTFFAADRQPYENRVRYLVTSLDTQFLGSSTGVFVAFHHLEQQLERPDDSGSTAAQMDFERLQLMVSQNLNFLLGLASDWAVQLNMELSRGGDVAATPAGSDDRVRRRILGGIAVKF